ncbi:MAG: SDR family oxidoreductase [Alphaproteobacteria bacterium]
MSEINLNDRVAIVTGASRGMGLVMAEAIVDAGGRAVLMSPETDELIAATKAIAERVGGGRVRAAVADITDAGDCERTVRDALDAFGALHILVNNAALGQPHLKPGTDTTSFKFWEANREAWQQVIHVNVNGTFLMAHTAVPHMIAQGWGRIVNVTTSLRTIQRGGNSPYGPSKAAIEAETLIWADDLDGTGVTVNSLIPGGAVNTAFVPENYRRSRQLVEPGIMGPPIVWLASQLADGKTAGRYVAKNWDVNIDPNAAAAKALEAPVFLRPPA